MRFDTVISRLLLSVIFALAASAELSAAAPAAQSKPGWEIASVAQPTDFSTEDNVNCASEAHSLCDRYMVTMTNIGGAATSPPLVITDTVPAGLKPVNMRGENLERGQSLRANGFGWSCHVNNTTCIYEGTVAPGGTLLVQVDLEVEAGTAEDTVTNAVRVTGGGAALAATGESLTMPNTVDGPSAEFGIAGFGFATHNEDGATDTQAGDHPSGVTTTIGLNTTVETQQGGELVPASVEPPKDIVAYLPLGFLGDPTATAQCTNTQLLGNGEGAETECPPSSRVGTVVLLLNRGITGTVEPAGSGSAVSAIYNMVPEKGYPAQFGFKAVDKPVQLYASVVHTRSGYALRVATPGIPTTIHVEGAAFTFFGEPNPPRAFFTNPDDCGAGLLTARVQADSWANPGVWSPSAEAKAVAYPEITGCNLLQFEPTVEMRPEVTQAEEPTGYEIKIKVPQSPAQFPVLATPQLKDVTMTLPDGMTISPGGGDGLTGCDATGPHGIDMPAGDNAPTEAGEGEAIGADGMTHLVPGHCLESSQIGTVEIRTPVLESPLEGHLYVLQPQCGGQFPPCTSADATNGQLFGVYLEAAGSGVVVKLRGSVSVNPTTGRLTARFIENPQLPVSEVTIDIEGGARAPLANPRQCGEALINGDLTPWSSPMTPDVIVAGGFAVDSDGSSGACPATLPFAPGFEAGVTNVAAGHFSNFTATVRRGDRQQDLARLQITTPAGMLGMLSKVSLCGEPQAAQGVCGEASQIGTARVAVGSGSHPLWVSGSVYLTGPYSGAPFGLSIVVPAVAGPFNLGNVVVRARIDVDPHTAAVTVTSDPLPQILDGVPLRIQTLNVAVDREGFIFNPTSCTAKQVSATIEAEQGASANVSAPFAVEGCRNLPFKPSFKVSTQGATSKKGGASLDVKIGSGSGQANIGKVVVSLPRQLPARLTTLQQACSEATFAANPATCPAGSNIGSVKVFTPVLNEPATGPAYLVSHGGAAFPDLVIILQAQGVRLDLVGNTGIKKGITTNTFASPPDAPITSFELKLPEGPHSALTSNLPASARGNLCGQKLLMATTLTGQNNALLKQSTKITVTGCPKVKQAKARKAAGSWARRARD